MKLLVLHDKPRDEMGGMTRIIAAQNALFRQAGWQVKEVICTPSPQADALHLPPSGRRIGLGALRQLRAVLEQERPDALIAHSVYFALSPLVLQALQALVPLVYVLHDVTPLCPRMTRLHRDGGICQQAQGMQCLTSRCYRPGEERGLLSGTYGLAIRAWHRRAARSVRQWVVPSHYLAELLQADGVAASRITVIPHFIPDTAAEPTDMPSPAAGRILFAGRLVAEKGIHCLLDALTYLHDIPWSLHIAGQGPELARVHDSIHQRGWSHRVQCLGALDDHDLTAQYQAATVIAMPSLIPESFGMVGLEAMRQRRPVVGFASGGMTGWLRHGVSGLVADWGDAQSLAEALRRLLTDPHRATQLGLQGHALAMGEYSATQHLQRMQTLLQNMVRT